LANSGARKREYDDSERFARLREAYLAGKMARKAYVANVKAHGLERYFIESSKTRGCLSCGEAIGDRRVCPRCSARQYGRVTEAQLVAVASVLLMIGMVYLGAASVYADTTISVVGDLKESDNFRHTRIVGKVVDVPDFYPEPYEESGTLRLLVDDGTGTIYVRTTVSVTSELLEDGRIPGFGDRVDCEGSLFVGTGGYMQIKVRDADLFRIVEGSHLQLSISDLVPGNKDDHPIGTLVTVSGRITDRYHMEGFAWIFDLSDADGNTLSVFLPQSVMDLTGELDVDAMYLSTLTVSGGLEWYERDKSWEIIPGGVDDIVITAPYTGDAYVKLTVAEFLSNASAYNNRYVELDNVTVAWAYADYLFSVAVTSSSQEEVSVFVDYDANASVAVKVGDKMSVRGWVTFYDSNGNGTPDPDEWEIKVRALSSDFARRTDGTRGD
jgi:DNA/RNA endonuclease YhcR with UshA esterase domain